jgi:hypothetical protein
LLSIIVHDVADIIAIGTWVRPVAPPVQRGQKRDAFGYGSEAFCPERALTNMAIPGGKMADPLAPTMGNRGAARISGDPSAVLTAETHPHDLPTHQERQQRRLKLFQSGWHHPLARKMREKRQMEHDPIQSAWIMLQSRLVSLPRPCQPVSANCSR